MEKRESDCESERDQSFLCRNNNNKHRYIVIYIDRYTYTYRYTSNTQSHNIEYNDIYYKSQ